MSQKTDLWVRPSDIKLAEIRAAVAQGYSYHDLKRQNLDFFVLSVRESLEDYLGDDLFRADRREGQNCQAKQRQREVEQLSCELITLRNSSVYAGLNFREHRHEIIIRSRVHKCFLYLLSGVKRAGLHFINFRSYPQGNDSKNEGCDEQREAEKN